MVNAYQGGTGHEATHALYGDLHRLAKEGKVGRKWYERSSKRILQHLGGDKNAADKPNKIDLSSTAAKNHLALDTRYGICSG